MKKLLILLVFAFVSTTIQAQELKWHTDVSDAAKEAIDSKKPLLLFFTGSDWCGWCKKLQTDVFNKPEFVKWAKQNVVLVELDFPRRTQLPAELQQQNAQMQQMFGVRGYPTIWFVNPVPQEGKKVNLDALGSIGYQKNETIWLQQANTILKKK